MSKRNLIGADNDAYTFIAAYYGPEEGEKVFQDTYGYLFDDPIYQSMLDVLYEQAKETLNFYTELQYYLPNLKILYPIKINKDNPQKIQIWRGMRLSFDRLRRLVKEEPRTLLEHEHLLTSFLALATAKTNNNPDAARKKVLSSSKEGIAGYLRKKGLSSSQTTEFIDSLAPPTLHFATTIAEMDRVIRECIVKSCTDPDSQTAHGSWKGVADRAKALPTSFYALCPETSMAYTVRGNQIRTRTVLYEGVDGKWAVRVFAPTRKEREQAKALLKEAGWPCINRDAGMPRLKLTTDFTFEGFLINNKGQKVFPKPYLDFHPGSLHLTWEEGQFKVLANSKTEPKSGVKLRVCCNTGFYTCAQARQKKYICAYCQRVADDEPTITKDGTPFCGNACATTFGYVHVMEAENTTLQIPQACFIRAYDPPWVYFSSLHACKRRGFIRFIEKLTDLETATFRLAIHRLRGTARMRLQREESSEEVIISSEVLNMLRHTSWKGWRIDESTNTVHKGEVHD